METVLGGDGVDAVEGGDVVVGQLRGVGDGGAAERPAGRAERLHDGPAGDTAVLERTRLEWIGIDLRVVEAENAAEGALELKAHGGEQAGVEGAEAVEQDDAVGDGGVGVDVVEPEPDAVVLATCGVACAGAEDGVDHGAVGIVDNADRVVCRGGGDVGGRGDDSVGGGDVGAVDVFMQRSHVRERDAGGGDGGPERGGRVDHGGDLLVGDGGVERAPIDVVAELAAGPVDGLSEDGGIEEGAAGHVFGAAGEGGTGGEKQKQQGSRLPD